MMHLAYPNVIDRQFRACVRYISALQNPVPSVYTSTSDAPPNTPNLATLRAVTHRLAPEWSTQGGYKVRLYEKADVRGTWQGASLDLAYLLASIRCVRSLRLEAFVDAGDVWCTGAIGALESGAPRLRAVAAAEFAAKLAGFVAQPHDRFFLVPAANIHTQLYELCATHDVQVLPLADFQQALPEAVAACRWAGQAVILIEEDQLQALVATFFAPPLSAAAPPDDTPTPEPMLRRPYRFLAAFAREDADLFYGRAWEIRRLQSLLPMARVLILHGASGTGKTSLLQAGLLPRLPPARYAVVQVRIVDDEPTRAIKAALLRAFGMAPRSLDLPLLDVLTAATAAVGKAVVVILDQFEELFLRFPPAVRQGLQQELGACVAAPLAVHFVLALREDYLAPLAEFQDTIPTLLTHTMRLTRLPVAQALDAVVEPARRLGITVDETLIREILLPQLADAEGRIDPPLLQLVCDALYQQAQDAEHTSIGQAEYTALGDVRAVLQDYLQAMLQQFGPDQPRVREVLKALVAADGTTRRTVFLADLLSRLHTAGVCLQAQALKRLLLRRLVHRRLVRVDEVEGRARYELVHDFLVPSIAAWMTADDRTPLAAKELIEQAYEGFTRTGLLLERAALHWIAPYEGRLDLPPEQHAFLARSRRETGRQRRRLWLRVGTLLLLVGLGIGGGVEPAGE